MQPETDRPDDGAATGAKPFDIRRRPGGFLFAAGSCALALFLLFQLPEQTRWVNRVDLLLQPRFRPSVVLAALTLFSGLYLLQSLGSRKDPEHLDTSAVPTGELLRCLRPLEYALYFVAYAASIPWLGYQCPIMIPRRSSRSGPISNRIASGISVRLRRRRNQVNSRSCISRRTLS